MDIPRLVANNVGKKFGRRLLFRRLSLELAGGEVLAVTGANGSGKSTLLKILAGLVRASAGEVTLFANGRAVAEEERPFHAGLVSAEVHFYEHLSARENLQFLARARLLDRSTRRIEDALEKSGLASRADERVAIFSTGMRQRLRIAAALMPDPPLLLLDEPAAGLDDEGRSLVQRVIEQSRQESRLVALATNRPDELELAGTTLCVQDYA